MNSLRKLRDATVFKPINPDDNSNIILATLYHRSAATLYLVYVVWGVVSFAQLVPTHFIEQGSFFQQVFSTAVTFAALIAMCGALFFPKTGRFELFAGSTVAILFLLYIVLIFIAVLNGDTDKLPTLVFGASHLVVPISRTIFIYLTLIKTASRGS